MVNLLKAVEAERWNRVAGLDGCSVPVATVADLQG